MYNQLIKYQLNINKYENIQLEYGLKSINYKPLKSISFKNNRLVINYIGNGLKINNILYYYNIIILL